MLFRSIKFGPVHRFWSDVSFRLLDGEFLELQKGRLQGAITSLFRYKPSLKLKLNTTPRLTNHIYGRNPLSSFLSARYLTAIIVAAGQRDSASVFSAVFARNNAFESTLNSIHLLWKAYIKVASEHPSIIEWGNVNDCVRHFNSSAFYRSRCPEMSNEIIALGTTIFQRVFPTTNIKGI